MSASLFAAVCNTSRELLCIVQSSEYLEQRKDMKAVARIALRRIEHLYYKTDVVYDAIRAHTIAQQQVRKAKVISSMGCYVCMSPLLASEPEL